jgi:hypothetical protein
VFIGGCVAVQQPEIGDTLPFFASDKCRHDETKSGFCHWAVTVERGLIQFDPAGRSSLRRDAGFGNPGVAIPISNCCHGNVSKVDSGEHAYFNGPAVLLDGGVYSTHHRCGNWPASADEVSCRVHPRAPALLVLAQHRAGRRKEKEGLRLPSLSCYAVEIS